MFDHYNLEKNKVKKYVDYTCYFNAYDTFNQHFISSDTHIIFQDVAENEL